MSETASREDGATQESLLITIEQWRGALPLDAVEEVVSAVAITPLSGARGPVLGYVDVRGDICPVIDARRILGLRRRALRPGDRMVILGLGPNRLIIPVDEASRVCHVRVIEGGATDAVPPDRPGGPAGLRAASIDEPSGEIVALVDPVAVFGRFARERPTATATATEVGSAASG